MPIDPRLLPAFLIAVALVELTPGPNMGYLAVLSASRGRGAGLAAVAGVTLGLCVYMLAAVTGITEILAAYPALLHGLRWAGVAYIVWLALETWRGDAEVSPGHAGPRRGRARRYVWRGFIANLLNPKAALFYLLEWWTAVVAYPFNAGGRALHSWPAFFLAPVEIGALAAGAAGFAAFLIRGGLTRLHDPAFRIDAIERATRDRFVLALRCQAGADADAALAFLAGAGAAETQLVTAP